MTKKRTQGYIVLEVPGGYQVFWKENDDLPPRPVRVEPYRHHQSAYRKAKQLNNSLKEVEAMIERDGAIIL